MSKTLKIVGAIIVVLVVLALVAFFAWRVYTTQAIPKTEGTEEVAGLIRPVEIVRDEYGVAHIYAETPEDLFFAQGYVHAQERFWQMEIQRRIAAGRMSEVFGETTLDIDRFIRHFNFVESSEGAYAMVDEETKTIMDAYASGVNAYIGERSAAQLSLEFALLGLQGVTVEIKPWTPVDSISWGYMLIFVQGSVPPDELEMVDLLATVGEDLTADLLPPYREDRPVIIPTEELAFLNQADMSHLAEMDEGAVRYLAAIGENLSQKPFRPTGLDFLEGGSSNSYAISGDLTGTGMPLLANDPHMGIDIPSLWYENGLRCVQKSADCIYELRGFSLPGVPGILIGHNDRIAWGLTNAAFDAEDVFVERINPEDPNQYEVNGDWQEMDVRREEIQVRGWDRPEVMFVRNTRNGVVISDDIVDDTIFGFDDTELDLYALSMAWTALEPVRPVQAVQQVNKAQNWDEFVEALEYFDAGKQNWLYADVDGNIGYILPGKIPIRADGDGTLPVPGWTDDYIWTGFIPYEDAPQTFNPEKGYIATANNPQVRMDDYPYLIAMFQDRGQRAQRAVDMIESDRDGISLGDMQRIQTDNQSLSALEVLPYLEGLEFAGADVTAARDRLLSWDAQMHMDSSEAALFNIFWVNLIAETFHDQLPERHHPSGKAFTSDTYHLILQEPDSVWWDDVRTADVVETRDDILARAFAMGYAEAVELLGDDTQAWRWGDLHTKSFIHQTLGQSGISLIENIFNRGPVAASGSSAVIQKTDWDANDPFAVNGIPALRQVIDLGDFSNSRMIHAVGQSGHPMHDQYDHFIEPWRHFEYHPTNWSRADAEAGDSEVLVLEPPS